MDKWISIHAALAFFALIMATISLWLQRSTWIWGSFLLMSGLLGYYADLVEPSGFIPIGALFILQGILRGNVTGMARFLLASAAIVVSLGLYLHYFPGFHPISLIKNTTIGKDAAPFSLSLSFDKPFAGFFVLAWSLPLLQTATAFKEMFKRTLPFILAGMLLLAALGMYLGLIQWDPKYSPLLWIFAPINLFLVTIPEEAFLRGFVQTELVRLLGGKKILAQLIGVLLTALLFAGLHYHWVPSLPFLGLVFGAGLIYGSLFQFTQMIETSITCHYFFNLIHFTLFSYPILKHAI